MTAIEQDVPQVEKQATARNPKLLHASRQFWVQIELQLVKVGELAQIELQLGYGMPEKKYAEDNSEIFDKLAGF